MHLILEIISKDVKILFILYLFYLILATFNVIFFHCELSFMNHMLLEGNIITKILDNLILNIKFYTLT
jgi:hypothetical protein